MFVQIALSCAAAMMVSAGKTSESFAPFSETKMAQSYFGADAPWFERNIPFFECSDPKLQEIYYYRWKSYKAHIRDLGSKGFVITEFLDDVSWQKHPYAMLNDATGFHIHEGRWLRDRKYMEGFIDFLYPGGGNDRHFSESIADATYAYTLVTGDQKWATQYLPAMRHIYNLWDDHFDFSKGLYYIQPLLDATEYTISSVDASGGKDGFRGGDAFRPSINAYMYANAEAISKLSAVAGDQATAADYANRAAVLKEQVQNSLWNHDLNHFTDRYQVTNDYVKYWNFIRGRELAGYVPWAYGLPDDKPEYNKAWSHILSSDEFAGPFGLRTVGPSYQYYMKQYRYEGASPECQWNGPSWPFQTTQALLGMANLIDNYKQDTVTANDYVRLLRQYAQQHYLDGKPNLQEDYYPDTGKPIVGLDRSQHYNHSGFNDLIVTGLCGLRPRPDDTLEINPIIPSDGSLPYFCLQNVPYHGHAITVIWDVDGKKYGQGAGLSIYSDGKRIGGPSPAGKLSLPLKMAPSAKLATKQNLAVNVYRHGFPVATASSDPHANAWQAVDGRSWFFPEMVRGWSPDASDSDTWYSVELDKTRKLTSMNLYFYSDGTKEMVPDAYLIEAWENGTWNAVEFITHPAPVANGQTAIKFKPVEAKAIRVRFTTKSPMRLTELELYE